MPNITAGFSWLGLVVLLAVAILPGSQHRVHAQEATAWTKEQIVERLVRTEPEPLTRSLRGIVVGGGPEAAAAEPDTGGWIDDLRVTFPFDSAEITPDARQTLDLLGQALLDGRLSADRFEIAGHTDGVGAEQYNEILSERRAEAVVDYLSENFGLPRDRLVGRGYGKAYLADPEHPRNPINRRVEILNLGSG